MRSYLVNSLLLSSTLLLLLSSYQITRYWDYEETIADLNEAIGKTTDQDSLLLEVRLLIDSSKFDDARMLIAITRSVYPSQNISSLKTLALEIEKKDTKITRLLRQSGDFARGFVKGKSSNVAGIAGSIAADFTVIGDTRDLLTEYGKYKNGESINELIVLLSGTGISLTALTLGTRGVAAPVKVGTSIIKAAAKSQRLTRNFQYHITKLAREAFDWPLFSRKMRNDKSIINFKRAVKESYHADEIKPLKQIAKQIDTIRKSTSIADTAYLLKYIDTPHDLIQLEKISLKYGSKTKGMVMLLGKTALRTVKVLKKTTTLLLALAGTILSGLLSIFLLSLRKTMAI